MSRPGADRSGPEPGLVRPGPSLREAGPETVAIIKAFAAGAVTSSLATEVFPQAYAEDRKSTGFAVALGLIVAFLLGRLSGG